MKTVCKKNQCTGCMACIENCPQNAILVDTNMEAYNAFINEEKCINCGKCYKVCAVNNPVPYMESMEWYQGWCKDIAIRKDASSGGIAGAIEKYFIETGGVVCSCTFLEGEFKFAFIDKVDELYKFSGSKYVKSNLSGMYQEIKKILKGGRKLLFCGLPCQVAALRNFVGEQLEENLFTIDLICHGTPDVKVLQVFLNQYDIQLKNVKKILFRTNTRFQLISDDTPIGTKGTLDNYTIAFLNAISYTENCYSCQYAKRERVSDITLGDSWGSNLNIDLIKNGVSLILCQTPKGHDLIENSKLKLYPVNLETAIENNRQLQIPSSKPVQRKTFFVEIQKGKFNRVVRKIYTQKWIKQRVKAVLLRLRVIKIGDITHKLL